MSRTPPGLTAPRWTEQIKLEAAQGRFEKRPRLHCGPQADRSTPTSDFNGGVGGRSVLEGVHAHVHASIVPSGFAESAQEEATCEPSGCQHTRTHTQERAHTGSRADLYSVFRLEVRVSGISSPFFVQKLSWWTPCTLVRLHCSMSASPSTGSTACSEALIVDSVKERRDRCILGPHRQRSQTREQLR